VDFTDLAIVLKEVAGKEPAVVLSYGKFIQTVVDFAIVAFAIFLMVKAVNSLKKKEEESPAEPPKQELLLTEIRDLLKEKA
jgi:large conductance mechanosensitive channel